MSETQTFLAIPVRSNCDTVTWLFWNILRIAGLRLEQIFGSGLITETQQTITDNQSSAANVTGFSGDATLHVRKQFQFSTYRTDGTNTRTHVHEFWIIYNAKLLSWRIGSLNEEGESCTSTVASAALSGVTFSVTPAGAVQYTSDSMGGTYVGKMRGKCISTFDLET